MNNPAAGPGRDARRFLSVGVGDTRSRPWAMRESYDKLKVANEVASFQAGVCGPFIDLEYVAL